MPKTTDTWQRCGGCGYRHDPADAEAHTEGLIQRQEQNAEWYR